MDVMGQKRVKLRDLRNGNDDKENGGRSCVLVELIEVHVLLR